MFQLLPILNCLPNGDSNADRGPCHPAREQLELLRFPTARDAWDYYVENGCPRTADWLCWVVRATVLWFQTHPSAMVSENDVRSLNEVKRALEKSLAKSKVPSYIRKLVWDRYSQEFMSYVMDMKLPSCLCTEIGKNVSFHSLERLLVCVGRNEGVLQKVKPQRRHRGQKRALSSAA